MNIKTEEEALEAMDQANQAKAVEKQLEAMFWLVAVFTLLSIALTATGHGDSLTMVMGVGAVFVIITVIILVRRGRLLKHISENW